jgi:pimeloyl-ACP methyl ester carboxylesterase
MEGKLFRYGHSSPHVAFITGPKSHRHAIIVGGLTDGMLFSPYVHPLTERLVSDNWSVVHTLFSSSHKGWGLSNLNTDADELLMLSRHLQQHYNAEGIAIIGHSTGCQDIMRYAEKLSSRSQEKGHPYSPPPLPLLAAVLQGPASDKEWLASQPNAQERLEKAENMVAQGKGDDVLYIATEFDGAAVTANRFCALACHNGDEDYFSSDLSDDHLVHKFQGLRKSDAKVMFLISGSDEYMPEDVDKTKLGGRFVQAMSYRKEDGTGNDKAQCVIVQGGSHNLAGKEEEAVEVIRNFLKDL